MKRLLIIGASVLQLPAILKARELGLYVGVIDMNPDAAGIKFADKFYEVSTIDIPGVIAAAIDFVPDGVMTLATDMPMRSVAAVAEYFGLHGISPSVALNATDKVAMIECFKNSNVPAPWFYTISSRSGFIDLLKHVAPPFVLKPNDSSGSRGVVLVETPEMALSSFDYSRSKSRSGIVLVEEYLQGPEVSVEIITFEGISDVLAVTDKQTTGAPYFVEMGHSQPSMLPYQVIEKIKEISVKAVESVGINNCSSHVEIIVTPTGPKLVELGARLGGDCITTHLVPLSTGIDMVKASIDLALGLKPDTGKKFKKGAAIRYITTRNGILKEINGIDMLSKTDGVKLIEIVKKVGEQILPIRGSGDRVGYVICQSDTPSEAISQCEDIIEKIEISVI
ncbi:MAG: ATP-grasp domain-containing protein [Bacteroidales bacterium]|nr:ATP-grasp domain-containing protein [Bacteroidales bacterium]